LPSLYLDIHAPRSTFTVAELVQRVRSRIGMKDQDCPCSGDIVDWANEGQDLLARDSLWYRGQATVGITSGVATYDMPIRLLAVEWVHYRNEPLIETTAADLYLHFPYWRTDIGGQPRAYYLLGNSALGLYPTPAQDEPDAVELYLIGLPPRVVDPQDQFYIPFGAETAIQDYCILQASLQDAHGEGGQRIAYYEGKWREQRKALRKQVYQLDTQKTVVWGGRPRLGRPTLNMSPGRLVEPPSS
jgi:hypothetical protein